MNAFFGFGATPSGCHGSLFARVRSPLVPLCIAPHACVTAPNSMLVGCSADVGPEGHPSFVGRIFRACAKPGTGPFLRPSCHVSQHTTPESGRAPGPPASPGWIFSHRSSVFPSFGDSFGVPHPGTRSKRGPLCPTRSKGGPLCPTRSKRGPLCPTRSKRGPLSYQE